MNDLSETARLTKAPEALADVAAIPGLKQSWAAAASDYLVSLANWWSRQPIPRFLSQSLSRRIVLSNILGLTGLLAGMLYLSLAHGWLLDAKVDVVKTLSRVTAEAVALRASNERRGPLAGRSVPKVQRDDAFASLELPISPEHAAPILKKLIQPTDLTARIYSPKGTLIMDSEVLFGRANVNETLPSTAPGETPRLKNFWTRLHYWLINKELKVYRELGTANGFLYPEVKLAAQQGVETPILLLDAQSRQIVSMAAPIKKGTKILGVLLLSTRPGEIEEILWDERRLILQIAAIALLASLISSLFLVRNIAGPMSRLSEAARHVSQNIATRRELPDFSERRDEVGQMGRAFRAMTGALYKRIEGSEKFAADVAHELKNPLAAARSTAEALTYAKTQEDRDHLVQQIQDELKRLNRLINDVSNASRLDAELARQHISPTKIRSVLSGVCDIFRDTLDEDNVAVRLSIEPVANESQLTVLGNDGRLAQVFTNLIDNAVSFSPKGSEVTIRAKVTATAVEVMVEDEGPGLPPDRLETVFERFYSDRPATDSKRGKNSGLGLSISREIVLSHRGEIFAENRQGIEGKAGGARFVVRLPRADWAGGPLGGND